MKKNLFTFISTLLVASSLLAQSSSDYTRNVTENGIIYVYFNKTKEVVVKGTVEYYSQYYDGDVLDILSKVKVQEGTFEVTKIADDANFPHTFTQIRLPETITSIGKNAFKKQHNLTSITIPKSVTSLGDGAFSECENLESIEIPGVTSIGESAFSGCTKLSKIEKPQSLITIGDKAFKNCEYLETVDIPNNVTSIGSEAFRGCIRLKNISIGKSVSSLSIGKNAFAYCKALKTIDISLAEKNISIEEGAFRQCTSLNKISLPKRVSVIGTEAFAWCENLKEIIIENPRLYIQGGDVFAGCESIESVSLPSTNYINAENLNIVIVRNGLKYKFISSGNGYSALSCIGTAANKIVENPIIPNSINIGNTYDVISIDACAFLNNTKVRTITLESNISEIGNRAFYGATSLYKIICYAKYPPSVEQEWYSNFNGYLVVPCDSYDSYCANPNWGAFKNISCEQFSTDISDIANKFEFTIANNQILVNGEAPAFVYTISGQKIANQNLKFGVYFVNVEGETVKVVMN